MTQENTLDALAKKHKTEKSSDGHGYCHLYESYLGPIKDLPVAFLEIGIQTGASHNMWHEWMPMANIYGLDVQPSTPKGGYDRLTYFAGDQSDVSVIQKIVDKAGPLDVVIDDGGHVASSVIRCFELLFKHLKPGGLYVIEDLHVGNDDRARQRTGQQTMKMGTSTVTTLEWLQSLPNPHLEFGSIEIYDDNICFIRKPNV